MSQKKPGSPTGGKSYYIGGDVHGTVIQGERNIMQMFPRTADGNLLAQQFKELIEEIGTNTDLDDETRKLAIKKTEAVAESLATAAENPDNLKETIVDAKGFLSSTAGWVWGKMKAILASEAAQKTIGTISEAAVRGAIKSVTGGP